MLTRPGESALPWAFMEIYSQLGRQGTINECIGLLTGQSVPIFRCGRKRRFHADRHALNDQWHYASRSEFLLQPGAVQSGLPWIQLSGAPCVASVAFLSCTNPALVSGTAD